MPVRALLTFFAPMSVYLIESIAFVLHPFGFSGAVVRYTYPQTSKLEGYCSAHPCLYDPLRVGSVYSLQLLSFCAVCLLYFWLGRGSQKAIEQSVRAVCAILICGVMVDYLIGNFAFDPKWFAPNSIASSPLGVFRYALAFTLASFAVAIVANPPLHVRRHP